MKGQKIRPRASGAPARRPLVVFLFGLTTSGCHQSTPANAAIKAAGLFRKLPLAAQFFFTPDPSLHTLLCSEKYFKSNQNQNHAAENGRLAGNPDTDFLSQK